MNFLGYPIGEWSILIGILGTLFGFIFKFIGKRTKEFANQVIENFKREAVDPLNESIKELSKSFEKESDWIHNQHQQVVKRLDDHDKVLNDHEERLDDHHDRLLKQELKGGKIND